MRIALITDGIWPYVLGGMQKHSYYLCKFLAGRHIHVDLYHFNRGAEDINLQRIFSDEELRYITSFIVDFPSGPALPGHYLIRSWKHSKRVFEAMLPRISTYDFIYTKGFTGWYLLEQKMKGRLSLPPIGVNFHGYEMFQHPPDLRSRIQQVLLLRRPVKKLSLMADKVFSYGGKITGIIRALGVPLSRIIEMPAGVEQEMIADAIRPSGEITRFLFLGRYERRKGIEELYAAISELDKKAQPRTFEFHFIGPIPAGKRMAHSSVRYHGEIRDKARMLELVRACDVLVCPSWSEGMPNVILEAMSQGLAIIATDVGATSLLVNADTGWLLNSPEPGVICSTLMEILNSGTGLLDSKKGNALLHVRNFTWNRLIDQLCHKLGLDKDLE